MITLQLIRPPLYFPICGQSPSKAKGRRALVEPPSSLDRFALRLTRVPHYPRTGHRRWSWLLKPEGSPTSHSVSGPWNTNI
jgi:hypothetical protein